MNRAAVVMPIVILVNACIWGFVILMTSRTLSGTGAYQQIQNILAAGAGISTIIVGGGLGALASKLKRSE